MQDPSSPEKRPQSASTLGAPKKQRLGTDGASKCQPLLAVKTAVRAMRGVSVMCWPHWLGYRWAISKGVTRGN